jgi:hypothetical protein
MLSINTHLYDAQNSEVIIRHRYCPVCHRRVVERTREQGWDNVVVTERELAPMPDGSVPTVDVVRERQRQARAVERSAERAFESC